jgi:hypothetical protein
MSGLFAEKGAAEKGGKRCQEPFSGIDVSTRQPPAGKRFLTPFSA